LAIPRLDSFRVDERGVLEGGGGVVTAGGERRRQKRKRERSSDIPWNS
jgi:hypothetical protein